MIVIHKKWKALYNFEVKIERLSLGLKLTKLCLVEPLCYNPKSQYHRQSGRH